MVPTMDNPLREVPESFDEARFIGFESFALRLGMLAGLMPILITLADLYLVPEALAQTLSLRLYSLLLLLAYPLALYLRVQRRLIPWILYGTYGVVEILLIRSIALVDPEFKSHLWTILYLYIVAPLLGLPLRFKANLAGLAGLLVMPGVLVALGLLRAFPTTDYYLMVLPMCLIMGYLLHLFEELQRSLHQSHKQLEALALLDSLTGLFNRRHFMQSAALLLKQAQRTGRPGCALLLDIDHFKGVNDRFGHAAGDEVIRQTAQAMRGCLRETDLLGRIGGEEFAILLPETSLEDARAVAERIRSTFADTEIALEGRPDLLRATLSIGLARLQPGGDSLEALLERADQGLYVAKGSGRNQVSMATDPL